MTGVADAATLREAAARLAEAGVEEPVREARVLARAAPDAAAFADFVARRTRREPVAYILGRREFWSLEFEVNPAVLIPRPDSETLIETAVRELAGAPPASILDLGCGSGCLLIALMKEFPSAQGSGIDVSRQALEVARRNAGRHGVAQRVRLLQTSFDEFAGDAFDLAIANPPYIDAAAMELLDPEVRFEPVLALAGGEDGLACIADVVRAFVRVLKPGALGLVETGHDQAAATVALMRREGLDPFRVVKDLAGCDRVVVARLPH